MSTIETTTSLEVSEDGISWVPCPLAGKAWHCGLCEVGVLTRAKDHCPNCIAAVRVVCPE